MMVEVNDWRAAESQLNGTSVNVGGKSLLLPSLAPPTLFLVVHLLSTEASSPTFSPQLNSSCIFISWFLCPADLKKMSVNSFISRLNSVPAGQKAGGGAGGGRGGSLTDNER